MKKAGLFVKLGFVALAATFWSCAVMAQSGAKYPGRKDTGTLSDAQVKSLRIEQAQTSNQMSVVKSKVDPRLAAKSRGGVTVARTGNTGRNCTSKSTMKPYSITRENFNKMPLDRQQFVLSHSDKYTIVD